MTPITVLLAEDHRVVREGIGSLLKSESDIRVVGEARDGRRAVQLAGALRPDVVIMDIAMPLLNGLEATRQILRGCPATRVLILSAHDDDEYIEHAAALGAAGYLIKHTSAHLLARAIRDVHAGKTAFRPGLSSPLLDRPQGPPSRILRLSSREMEVLQLIAEGTANKQTASEMGISIKTVEKHRQSLMGKLDIHDTAGLTRYAIAAGVIESTLKLSIA